MKKDCNYFAPLITGLVDQELDSSTRKEVEVHIAACASCSTQYANEVNVKKVVRERFSMVKAPAYLRARIRRYLARHGNVPSFWELVQSLFIYRPAAASFSLAVIAFMIILPLFQLVSESSYRGQPAALELTRMSPQAGFLQGKIICVDCEFLSHDQKGQVQHTDEHRAGLKTEDGTVWSFIYTKTTEELMRNPTYLRKSARVKGKVFPSSHLVYVESLEML